MIRNQREKARAEAEKEAKKRTRIGGAYRKDLRYKSTQDAVSIEKVQERWAQRCEDHTPALSKFAKARTLTGALKDGGEK